MHPEVYKMAALRQLLIGDIKKHVDLREEDLRVYTDLRQCVMKWALTKRLEKERKDDPMDTSQVGPGGDKPAEPEGSMEWPSWWVWSDEWGEYYEVNYTGKGGKSDEKGQAGPSDPLNKEINEPRRVSSI